MNQDNRVLPKKVSPNKGSMKKNPLAMALRMLAAKTEQAAKDAK